MTHSVTTEYAKDYCNGHKLFQLL